MLALGIASLLLTQVQSKTIPPIDWNNLPYQNKVKEMADGWRSKYHLPGVWCAFIKDGKVVACVATGVKNVETAAPALVTDYLGVGSVSKVITDTMIAELVARGVISFETTVAEVFPELAKTYPDSPVLRASLRQLVTHTAGLTKDVVFDVSNKADGIAWRYDKVRNALASPSTVRPGTRFEYNNWDPVMATAMVERAIQAKATEYGASYEDWLSGSLGKAIGLSNPKMLDYSKDPGKEEVQPHYIEPNGSSVLEAVTMVPNHRLRRESDVYATGGSCRVTLTDLCSFVLSTITNAAGLPANEYRETISATGLPSDPTSSAGWAVDANGWLHHSGSTGRGEYCLVCVIPEAKRATILYVNCGYTPGTGVRNNSGMSPLLNDFHHLEVNAH